MIAGFLTYIALFGLTAIWILGWMGLSVVVGSFFSLPLKTVSLVGATLGPLGFVVTICIGILENRELTEPTSRTSTVGVTNTTAFDDPFS